MYVYILYCSVLYHILLCYTILAYITLYDTLARRKGDEGGARPPRSVWGFDDYNFTNYIYIYICMFQQTTMRFRTNP